MIGKDIKFRLPTYIKHKETKEMVKNLVSDLKAKGEFSYCDIPNIHRMATAYDSYLTNTEIVSNLGGTMRNIKGEEVKRPEVNIAKENWAQFFDIAKDYGLTPKSKKKISGSTQKKKGGALQSFLEEKAKKANK